MSTPPAGIFKAYDIRGLAGEEIDSELAYLIGRAFALVIADREGKDASDLRLGLGRDMRNEAPELAARYAAGMSDQGAAVLDSGMVATEQLYHLVGSLDLDGGLMCTASHNPARYTGAKLVGRGALPLSGDSGIGEIKDLVFAGLDVAPGGGSIEAVNVTETFRDKVLGFVDPSSITGLKIVVDGGNGMAGPMIGPILESLDVEVVTAYWEPNGDFPDHEPNPLLEENRQFIMEAVKREGADLGIAWDGDADRCFFIDDTGSFVDGDFLTALMARRMLETSPGATILYDIRASRAVADTVHTNGGSAIENRVGHAFFKARMREIPEAVFGGEVSGHYYFRDFWCADSGTIPALLMLSLLSGNPRRLSQMIDQFRDSYFISGEVNSEVSDPKARIAEIEDRFSDAKLGHLDGVTVDYEDWHFSLRSSNTEPLLRLCLESLVSQEDMETKRDSILEQIRGEG
ncbi:MAG: phosphomannomutase/phosphoglucomutase [Solirubrobacterales bacterium]|nr:phosphomannomutase/phosphoglucomutase [Solirubrobacterales bacterium]